MKKRWKFGFRGVFWNFKFGLRKKRWKFGFRGGILELRIWTYEKKMEIWISGRYSGTSNLDLGKKDGNLDFGGGVFWKGDGK